ncbi:MAG: glycine cleavage system aminomethyltransferase GcvT [Dehalococcoidia bacterium]|nr:glycine cleavage system aminomethyltransferase GcvT [Dehalococcoidia bacterium]
MTQQHESTSIQEGSASLKRTVLFQAHLSMGAQMVQFAGWEMPVWYSGILAEARAVRSRAGIFDVSHMGRVEITGADAAQFLHCLVTADMVNMPPGRARYTLICNETGGIIDDTIVYRLTEERFLLIPNASNADEVLTWLNQWKGRWAMQVEVSVLTQKTALIALQGPQAKEILQTVCSVDLSNVRPFRCVEGQVSGVLSIICRTGYTGEDGFEIVLPSEDAPLVWLGFEEMGAVPCGLGARDVLRLEAGLLLHGSDMDSSVTPLEAGLERHVNWDQGAFIGMPAIRERKSNGLSRTLVGFRLLERGVPRHGQAILNGQEPIGNVTSGTHSPTLDRGIGLGYVALEFSNPGTKIIIDLRGRRVEAEVAAIPFYSRNK